MTGRELPARATPVAALDVFLALRMQLGIQLGREVPRQGALILLAQMALETGRFKSCMNFNLGGIKASKKWAGDYQHFTTMEVLPMALAAKYMADVPVDSTVEIIKTVEGMSTVRFAGRHPVNKFVAFESMNSAMEHHVGFLLGRYRSAVECAMAGNSQAFVSELYRLKYFTGDRASYEKSVASLASEYERTFAPDAPPVAPERPEARPVTVAAMVAPPDEIRPEIPPPGPAPATPLPLPPVVPVVILATTKKAERPWGIRLLLWLLEAFNRKKC